MKEEVLCLKHQSIVVLRNTLIFVNKASKYNDEALTYAKKLIKANYNKATDAEIETLLKKQKINQIVVKQHIMEKVFLLVI